MLKKDKPLAWIGSSKKDLMALPLEVRKFFAQAVFVLHCFSKKSKRGIETPKEDMDIIRARLKVAEALAKEL
jgi:phage-related protein